MTIIVRTYETLSDVDPDERFFARAIAQDKPRKNRPGGFTEGFSVGFYAETAEAATAKALDWIEAERLRQAEIVGNRAAVAEKNRQSAAQRKVA